MSGKVIVSKSMRGIILSIGIFLIAISLFCSWTLYTGFGGEDSTDRVAWGGIGLGLDMFKNIALIAAFGLWALNYFVARVVSVVIGSAYVVLTILSFTAFFGFMSQVQHKLEQQAVLGSTQYEAAKAAADNAAFRVETLSVYANPSAVSQAEARIAELTQQRTAILAGAAAYTADCVTPKTDRKGSPFTSKMNEVCAGYSALADQIAEQQKIVTGYSQYQSAMAHKEHTLTALSGLDSGSVSTGVFLHPMFIDLGRLLAMSSEDAKVSFMFISSAAAEILGTLSLLIVTLLGRRRSFTLEEVEEMHSVVQEQQFRLAAAARGAHATVIPTASIAPPISSTAEPIGQEPVKRLSIRDRLKIGSDHPTEAMSFHSTKRVPLATFINYDDRYYSITIPGWECLVGDSIGCFVDGVKTEMKLHGFTRDRPVGTDLQVPIISLKNKDKRVVELSSPMSPNIYRAVDIGGAAVILLDEHGMPIEV